MGASQNEPWGFRWRSSRSLLVATVCFALFTETLLYTFLVPILSYMLEVRLGVDPSQTLRLTASLLGLHGFVSLIFAPVVAHYADKSSSRTVPLLMTLVGCIVGTLIVAWTPSLWALFGGRLIQGMSGSAAWIICLAMLVDNVPPDQVGTMMGLSMSCVMAGVVLGPTVAGWSLEGLGYWPAWFVPIIALVLDLIARLALIEPRSAGHSEAAVPSGERDPEADPLLAPPTPTTTSPVPETTTTITTKPIPDEATEGTPRGNFYRIMLSQLGAVVGLANVMLISTITTGFSTTLPLHLMRTFHWGTGSVGMVFFAMQAPAILLGPLVGWVRDRFGIRYPTVLGWALLGPLLWLLGVPGAPQFPWASSETSGKAMLFTVAGGLGVVLPLVRGGGMLKTIAVATELQEKHPGIFGTNGGNNRVFSMQEICFNIGGIIGPALTSTLVESVGYYYMNVVNAIICFLMALCCLRYF